MARHESIEIFEFDELSESAKKTAIELSRQSIMESEDLSSEILENCETILADELPWAPREDIRFRLSYSQGDGVAFYGPVNMRLFALKHPTKDGKIWRG